MRIMSKAVLFTILFCYFLSGVGFATEATINVSAEIKEATLIMTSEKDLKFGDITVTGPGKVRIDCTAGAATPAAVEGNIAVDASDAQSGLVYITSPVSANVDIAYAVSSGTSTPDVLTGNQDTDPTTLTFTGADVAANSTGGSGTLALTAGEKKELHIGGLLKIADEQAAATYSGTIKVTASY